ncbi:MAG: peptidylprolyl isomerase [Spirochaetales bacterium]|nr:peptidylprolyl isomerase [Spirochaetales bacterium]
MKKFILLLPAVLLTLMACNSAKLDEGVVARVNNHEILQADFDAEIDGLKKNFESQGQFLTDADLELIKPRLLDSLVTREVLLDKADSLKILPDTASVQLQMEQFKLQFPTEEDYTNSLSANGFTEDSLMKELEFQSVLQILFEQEVSAKISIAEEDIRAFYDDNLTTYFTNPESVETSHILVSVSEERSEETALAKINEIKAAVDAGMDFAAAAADYSDCPSKANGGNLGPVLRGQTVPEFEEAAFSQEVGVVGEPVLSQFGYHLVLVNAKNDASETPYEDVKPLIQQQLEQQAYEAGTASYVEELKNSAKIILPDLATAEPSAVQAPAQS